MQWTFPYATATAALWLLWLLMATGGPPSAVAAAGTGATSDWRSMAAGPQMAVAVADGRRRSRVSREFGGDATAQTAAVTEQLATTDAAEARTEVATDSAAAEAAAAEAAAAELPARELGDLLHMDTDKFSDKQKQLFKKIVERVARVSIAANEASAQHKKQLLKLQLDTEEHAVTSAEADDDYEPAVEEGRDSKVRQTKVKYPGAQTITTIAVGGKLAAGSKSGYSPTSTNSANTATTAIKQRPGLGLGSQRPTVAPQSEADKQKYKLIVNTNIARPASSVPTKMDNYTEVIFGNITTTSIVDSLSNDNSREQLLHAKNGQQHQQQQLLKKRPSTTAAALPATPETAASSAAELAENKKEPQIATAKPTKYHYYPHNQHIYLLPECAIQQVCNAVYVRLNYTQPLCACPSRYRDPCSASINEDDLHTTKLIGDDNKKAITLAKTCESTTEMRECRSPRDWSLLALQNTRTGKSHYLVICRCPDNFILEGPMAHDQPTYASVPGIRVFGMMCIKPGAGANRKPPQVPKRDHLYQQQQQQQQHQQQHKHSYQYQQQQQQLQSAYQQQQQLQQQQYQAPQQQQQPNYQYLHRPTSDRPVPSQSTPRSQSYQPHSVYHHQAPIVQPHYETIYDDVYARNGAGIEAVDPAANGTTSTSSSSSSSSEPAASSSGSSTPSASRNSAHYESTVGITAYTAQQTQAATTTQQQQQQLAEGRTETLSSAETTLATPVAVELASGLGSAADGAEERSNTAVASESQEDDSSSGGSGSNESSSNDIGIEVAEAAGAIEDQSQSESSSAADSTAEEAEEADEAAEEVEATTANGSAGSRRKRRAARYAAPDEDNLQAKLEAIIDQLLQGGDSETGGRAMSVAEQRLGRAQLVNEILARRK